ncbi:peptidase S8/S53 domain-containing protein [Mrakia frigida]|uniref:peptidase S8/S53 domain-containing protein n=1 Tax=Mrakia frigida TaxID=29902 RepID=UPI003FCBFBB2
MLFPSLVVALSCLASVSAEYRSPKKDGVIVTPRTVPHSWIVELSDLSSYGKRSVDPHEHFATHMKRASIPYTLAKKFDSMGLFVGASIKVDDANAATILALPSVIGVYPVTLVDRPTTKADLTVGVDSFAVNPTDTYSTHAMTGVDRLHNQGILGAGRFIAVVDSGIDFTHEALGGCFGAGCKVTKGYDFVGDNYDGTNTAVESAIPQDCDGHGTAVAGIIGANANALNFTGVAPAATLGSYRVFGCTGTAANEQIIAAMLLAQSDGADVINLSLGFAAGWSEDVVAVVASRIVAAGTVIVAAAGNGGAAGMYYADSPSTGLGVISVGSVDNIVSPGSGAILSDGTTIHLYATSAINTTATFSLALSTTDTTSATDACSPYPDTTDFTGKVVLVRRGTCSFSIKAQNVLDAGGEIILFYNDRAGTATVNSGTVPVQQALITQTEGEALVADVIANPALTISFPAGYINFPNPTTGGLTSAISSYGPKWDNNLSVSLTAPGGSILSTGIGNTYVVNSGTSEASPFIAGVAALFISQNPDLSSPAFVHSMLVSTARPAATVVNGTSLHTVAQQGGGLVDAYNAVLFPSVVSPGSFALNDTDHASLVQTLTIMNAGSSEKSYRLANVPALAALTFSTFGDIPNEDEVPLVEGAATIAFSSTFVAVPAGSSVDVILTFVPPTGLDASNVPVYSGFVSVESADQSEVYSVPYLGVAASMKNDFPILDTSNEYFGVVTPALLTYAEDFVDGPVTFTFTATDQPSLIYRLSGGSAKVIATLVASDTTFTPSILKKRNLKDHNRRRMIKKRADPALPASLGTLFEITYNYRSVFASDDVQNGYYQLPLSTSASTFAFADGTTVPNGDYKVLLRTLKLFGDETVSEDYESWLSPVVTVNHA